MSKLIGYARVSKRQQFTDRQGVDLVAAGVRRDDLCTSTVRCRVLERSVRSPTAPRLRCSAVTRW